MTISVMVFTRDLRLTDNPALTAAARAEAVVPLFVWDQQILGPAGANATRLGFLLDSLRDLDAGLRAAGEYIRRYLPELAGLPSAVVHDPDPATRRRRDYPEPIVDHRDAIAAYRAGRRA